MKLRKPLQEGCLLLFSIHLWISRRRWEDERGAWKWIREGGGCDSSPEENLQRLMRNEGHRRIRRPRFSLDTRGNSSETEGFSSAGDSRERQGGGNGTGDVRCRLNDWWPPADDSNPSVFRRITATAILSGSVFLKNEMDGRNVERWEVGGRQSDRATSPLDLDKRISFECCFFH